VDDVTTHPAFRNAAHTVAAIYDMKADSANREIMSFTDGGEQCSMYYLRARTQADLRRRMRAHRIIADILNKLRKKC
jgi:4-hydroxyphenylacetate 3-monooxygenase